MMSWACLGVSSGTRAYCAHMLVFKQCQNTLEPLNHGMNCLLVSPAGKAKSLQSNKWAATIYLGMNDNLTEGWF